VQGLSARLVRDVARVLKFRLYGEEPPPGGSDFMMHEPRRSLADSMADSTALVEQLRVFRSNPDIRAWITPGARYKWGYRWRADGCIADGSHGRWLSGVSARRTVRQAAILETRQRIRWKQRVEQVRSGRRMWHAVAGLPAPVGVHLHGCAPPQDFAAPPSCAPRRGIERHVRGARPRAAFVARIRTNGGAPMRSIASRRPALGRYHVRGWDADRTGVAGCKGVYCFKTDFSV
jgi:hypothetical protein